MENYVLFLLLTASSMTDIRNRYVDNQLLIFCGISGVFLRVMHGIQDPVDIAGGILIPFLILFPFYAVKFIGAGDVKLLMVIGIFIGLSGLKNCLIPVTAVSVCMAVVMLARGQKFRDMRIPMAVPISLGVLLSRV
ncbi:Type IV leader peptidase family protein [Lachnospiraceae bacterium]|nr:Type IV leader peptidase family protein [Lachnospiraceae bacterium]